MTAAELGFIAAVCAAPADDTARLVYADWLDEHGQPERAEFIRVQVELAAIPNPPAEPPSPPTRPEHHDQLLDFLEWRSRWRTPYYALRRRERELWATLGVSFDIVWYGRTRLESRLSWESGIDREGGICVVSRGFVSHVTCTAEDWLAHADALHWHPGQRVECPTCRGHLIVSRPPPKGPGGTGMMADDCPDCRDDDGNPTGTVSRPCPATAQPLVAVTWTTLTDDDMMIRHGAKVLARPGQLPVWTFDSWPGIEFVVDAGAPVTLSTRPLVLDVPVPPELMPDPR